MHAAPLTLLAAATACLATCWPTPGHAMLKNGTRAPDFTIQAARAGNEFSFHLAEALRHGPVVLYFYPAAFSSGCTREAHDFADAAPQFLALHTTIVGVSMDNIVKLQRFSTSECHSKFAVASDKYGTVSNKYDAVLVGVLGWAARTSYVIVPTDAQGSGRVIYAYNALDPEGHVANTLKALNDWSSRQRTAER